MKQWTLKPQDLLVALKVAVNPSRSFVLADLASELSIAVSQVHGSVVRAEQAQLISRASGQIKVSADNLREFVIHGARYSFPAALGTLGQGMPTAAGGPPLAAQFEQHGLMPPVWPHAEGRARGPMLSPLHPSVPDAAARDPRLYEALSLFDALRVGAARERTLAVEALKSAF